MKTIIIYTKFGGEFYLESNSSRLPISEFIVCKNYNWETCYINRSQISYYTVSKNLD
jgi:hypothetical protein